eukprot:944964-Amphidinium_carterae.1
MARNRYACEALLLLCLYLLDGWVVTPGIYEDYVHRIGRTGRAGDAGDAFTFLSEWGQEKEALYIKQVLWGCASKGVLMVFPRGTSVTCTRFCSICFGDHAETIFTQ